MATLALTNDEIYQELGYLAGISRDNSDWDATTQADMDRVVRSGRRRFLSAYKWNFLEAEGIIVTAVPFTDGTITIAAGVVTFAGGPTVPTNATDFVLAPTDGGVYTIASYDSTTQITLDDTSLTNAVADGDYNLYQIRYDLPSGFGGWEGPVSIGNHNGRTMNETRNLPDFTLKAFANMERVRTGEPRMFSVNHTVDTETAIATYQMTIFPLPDAVYTINYKYRIAPGDTLAMSETAVVSNPVFTECYKESILAAAEVMIFDQPGTHSERFEALLQEAVQADKQMKGVRHGRPRRAGRGLPKNYDLIVGTVDFSDQEIT